MTNNTVFYIENVKLADMGIFLMLLPCSGLFQVCTLIEQRQ